LVLCFENLCLTEKSHVFIPQPRQAPERYVLFVPKLRRKKSLENTYLFAQKNFKAEA
jgi:hypothetical protein